MKSQGGHPHALIAFVDTACYFLPNIGIVMQDPSVLAIHGLSRFLSGFAPSRINRKSGSLSSERLVISDGQ